MTLCHDMFVIPAAIFAGYFTWLDYLWNFIAVFIGNGIGGGIFVGMIYWIPYIWNTESKAVGENQNFQLRQLKPRR